MLVKVDRRSYNSVTIGSFLCCWLLQRRFMDIKEMFFIDGRGAGLFPIGMLVK